MTEPTPEQLFARGNQILDKLRDVADSKVPMLPGDALLVMAATLVERKLQEPEGSPAVPFTDQESATLAVAVRGVLNSMSGAALAADQAAGTTLH